MNLKQKIDKSKLPGPANPMAINVEDNGEAMVALKDNLGLKIIPIWEEQIDEHEGPAYQKFISTNPKYNQIYVRENIAKMLTEASLLLPSNWQLIVRAGHRPVEVQLQLLEMLKQGYLKDNPGSSDQEALTFARTYVSDPKVKVPPHCCGAAVDVDVLNKETNELIDFGCPVNTDDPVSFLYTNKITKQQKQNRQILLEAMLNAGFASFSHEWWHYSYGDQTWAWFYNKEQAIYAITQPEL